MAKLMLASSHKTGTQNAGLFIYSRFSLFKLCMHQVHEFASVLHSKVCQPARLRLLMRLQ